MTVRAIDKDTFAREWADWHRLHEENLASPNGWLTITGLHWLGPEPPADRPCARPLVGLPGRGHRGAVRR